VAAIAAATMLSLLPVRKSLASLDGRFATNAILPSSWQAAADPPPPVTFRACSGTKSRLPRDREDPCSFRTRLIDPTVDTAADLEPEMDVEGAHNIENSDLKFDDTQCISIGRSTSNVKPVSAPPTLSSNDREDGRTYESGFARGSPSLLHSTPAVTIIPADDQPATIFKGPLNQPSTRRAVSINEIDADSSDSDDDVDAMETVNMPFWHLPRREKRHSAHDSIPDDMSIISDASLVPTYFPSDAAKWQQQQQRPQQHRALIRHLFRAKARAARQTMRELKRSCRDVVGNVFVEASAPRGIKCVAVGAAP